MKNSVCKGSHFPAGEASTKFHLPPTPVHCGGWCCCDDCGPGRRAFTKKKKGLIYPVSTVTKQSCRFHLHLSSQPLSSQTLAEHAHCITLHFLLTGSCIHSFIYKYVRPNHVDKWMDTRWEKEDLVDFLNKSKTQQKHQLATHTGWLPATSSVKMILISVIMKY